MPLNNAGVQYISPALATPHDYETRARIPSHVCAGLFHVRVYNPFVSLGDYDAFVDAAGDYCDDPLVAEAYEWLRNNPDEYTRGGLYGFIVYNVN